MISGRNGPRYIQPQKEFLSKSEDMLCLRDFMSAGVKEGLEVEQTSVLSYVHGNQLDPASGRYYSAIANIPFAKSTLALAHQKRGTLLRIGYDADIHDCCADNVRRRVSTFKAESSIGCSGSPAFSRIEDGGKKLLGLVIGANNDISHFQSLDFALVELRNSLSQSRQ